MTALRWGFLSTAAINDKLLVGARASAAAEVVAVASRDRDRAAAYAAERGIPVAHGSYDALLADPRVDAVYISLPNGLHVDWSIRALEAGKHVLCEKPLTRSVAAVERAFDVADRVGRVLTEGFMWRHTPQTATLARLVREGAIGELRLVRASFSFMLDEPANIRLDPALEGGALMDVGCYCVSGARLLAGEPEEAVARQVLGPSGVDMRLAGVLRHAGDVLSELHCGFDLPHRHDLEAIGSTGALRIADPWHGVRPGIELSRADGSTERLPVEAADPYRLQFEQFARAVAGVEPPLLGRSDAAGQARAIDALYRAAETGGSARV
jgi:predicted dehydrogenase